MGNGGSALNYPPWMSSFRPMADGDISLRLRIPDEIIERAALRATRRRRWLYGVATAIGAAAGLITIIGFLLGFWSP